MAQANRNRPLCSGNAVTPRNTTATSDAVIVASPTNPVVNTISNHEPSTGNAAAGAR